jgi:hypothetical protein
VFEIVRFFGERGYRVASEYTSRGTKGLMSLWMVKKEACPGADVPLEVTDAGALGGAASVMALSPQRHHQQQLHSVPHRGGDSSAVSGVDSSRYALPGVPTTDPSAVYGSGIGASYGATGYGGPSLGLPSQSAGGARFGRM